MDLFITTIIYKSMVERFKAEHERQDREIHVLRQAILDLQGKLNLFKLCKDFGEQPVDLLEKRIEQDEAMIAALRKANCVQLLLLHKHRKKAKKLIQIIEDTFNG